MDVSSVQKTRLTFALISTPMILLQHDIVKNTVFSDWVPLALGDWDWWQTPMLLAPLFVLTIIHYIRAYAEQHRYRFQNKTDDVELEFESLKADLIEQIEDGIKQYAILSKSIIYSATEQSIFQEMNSISKIADSKIKSISNTSKIFQINKIGLYCLMFSDEMNDIIQNAADSNASKEVLEYLHISKLISDTGHAESKNILIKIKRISTASAFANILSELLFPAFFWLVLLWPLIIHPAFKTIAGYMS